MRSFSIYTADGTITGQIVSCSEDQLAANLRGRLALEGRLDRICQRVDVSDPTNPLVVDHQPPQPDDTHEWRATNPDAKVRAEQRWRWFKKPEVVERELARSNAQSAIDALERAQLRPLRELAIDPENTDAKQRLQQIDDAIATEREKLADAQRRPPAPA